MCLQETEQYANAIMQLSASNDCMTSSIMVRSSSMPMC